jgi:hypothetical protein
MFAGCGQPTVAAPVATVQTDRPAPGLTMVERPRHGILDFQAGVTVLAYGNDPAFGQKARAVLEHLATLGVNSVGLAFPLYQSNWTASDVHADPTQTLTVANATAFTTEAHRRGFTVMLRPLLDEQSFHPDGKWRGLIQPSDPDGWFKTYAAALDPYVRLATAQHVEVFDVGTEFSSLQSDGPRWSRLIASVRRTYRGQVTYSANWQDPVPAFAKALDFLGVDAFYPLGTSSTATADALVTAWQPWLADIRRAAASTGKAVVITELGTTSEVGSYQQPWVWQHGTGVSLEAQAAYYDASCRALKPSVHGMYWWVFSLDAVATPSSDPGYEPEGKPAETQIGKCFG